MSRTAPVLEVRNLSVSRGATKILNQVTFTVEAGTSLAIDGPSGSGKSTLLACIAGLLRVDSGTVVVNGEHMEDTSDWHRSRVRLRSIGIVFQGNEFIPELTLGENISLPLKLLRGYPFSEIETRLSILLDRLGISDLEHRRPSEVSGGQLQRASVARALIHRPRLLLADEPTAALDAQASADAIALLVELSAAYGSTAVVVSHDNRAIKKCDRLFHCRNGTLMPTEKMQAGQ